MTGKKNSIKVANQVERPHNSSIIDEMQNANKESYILHILEMSAGLNTILQNQLEK
jgi:hypothetical protein